MGGGGLYLQQVIGCVQDALLLAAQQSLDQLLDDGRLLMDDGQVQRTVGKRQSQLLRFEPQPTNAAAALTDVSPWVSCTPHRCLWTASRTRVSPVLQYCSRAAAVCRAL